VIDRPTGRCSSRKARAVGGALGCEGIVVRDPNSHTMWLIATLTEQVVTLIVGFALTTVVGGLLGSWFQRRAWDHQNERTLAEADRGHATQTCRELSQLMDRRLYRMWQLNWALFAPCLDRGRVDACMQDYRAVLYEWNDALNRNLAAAEIQFGRGLRNRLEGEIYEGFRSVGEKLEATYRELPSMHPSGATHHDTDASGDLREMRERVYAISVVMLQHIRDGRVGRSAKHQ
jgi:hypothetical protein